MSTQPTNSKYWAFISYSHKDSDIAERLHKKLETYKVPKSLIGTSQHNGVVPRRIFPVFRDRDELPTSSDLGQNIRQSLSNSRYLIVIASPDSASSRWVDEEVSWFKRVHQNSNVLVMIAKGEPNATDKGTPLNECFCPSLRFSVDESGQLGTVPSEPIAADIRASGDGESRAFLKIVAGILGVSFDDLYKREARRRRMRLLLGASGGAVVAIAFAAIMTNLARVKKDQAEISVKQQEIQDVVGSMRESGPYKEIGKLPSSRRKALEKTIEDSGVESFIASMKENTKKDFDREDQLFAPLRRIASDEGIAEIIKNNPQEKRFVKLLGIWVKSFDAAYESVSESKQAILPTVWEGYSAEFYKRVGVIQKFSSNLEERLVVEDLWGELQNRFYLTQSAYCDSDRWTALDKLAKSTTASLERTDHYFNLEKFTKEYKAAALLKPSNFDLQVKKLSKSIEDCGNAPMDKLAALYANEVTEIEKFMVDSSKELERYYQPEDIVYSAYLKIPKYDTILEEVNKGEMDHIRNEIKQLRELAKISDTKSAKLIKGSNGSVSIPRLQDQFY